MSIADDLHVGWTRSLREADNVLDVSNTHEQKATNAVVARMRGSACSIGGARLGSVAPSGTYDGGACIADARLVLDGGGHVLVESKWYWKSYWVNRRNVSKARTYLFAPLEGRDNKSAVLDLAKLARLRGCGDAARHAALVIVAHSQPAHGASADLDEFAARTFIDRAPWESAGGGGTRWASPRWSGYEYDVRVFTCPTDDLSVWWSRFEPLLRASGWTGP